MSQPAARADQHDTLARLTPIATGTVAALAYEQLRALILSGEMAAGARLSQLDLAERLQISRTPVREALRRLTGEGLVDALPQRGFRVADLGLDAVMRRLEVRRLLEPGIARLAAERASATDLAAMREAVRAERAARDGEAAHDASRAFHMALARSTQNTELVITLESKWIIEVGRRLLSRRAVEPDWQERDVAEHGAIVEAVQAGDGELAERLMRDHVNEAVGHWNPIARHDGAGALVQVSRRE